jgi:hypothetical protein
VLFWKRRCEQGREKVLIFFVKATGFGVAESFSFFLFFLGNGFASGDEASAVATVAVDAAFGE